MRAATNPAGSALVALVMLVSCAGTPSAPGPDLTGGVTLDAFARSDVRAFARYRVRPDGTIAFAGATDAIDRSFTWHGPLTADELERFRALVPALAAAGDVRDAARGATGTVEIELETPSGRSRWRAPLDDERLGPLLALLETAARRRHEADLEMLPRANAEPPASAGPR